MHKIPFIARREYLETIKTRTFILSVVLTPLLMIGVIFLNGKMMKSLESGARPARRVAVVDRTAQLGDRIQLAFQRRNEALPEQPLQLVAPANATESPDQQIAAYKSDILAGNLAACIVVAPDAIDEKAGGERSQCILNTKNIADLELYSTLQNMLNEAVVAERYTRHNLSPELITQLRQPVLLDQVEVNEKQAGHGGPNPAKIMIPFFFMFLMFMGIMGTSQGLITSVIEEKNSRIMEVLLAIVSPFELMAGKILGLAGVGLTLIAVWLIAGAGAAQWQGMTHLITVSSMVYFLIYYILGFTLLASIFAAIGSACNTLKEAQNLLGPVTMLLVLPMIFWPLISQNPMGPLATAMGFFPPTTSMIMVLRLNANPDLPAIQIVGSILLLIVSAWAGMWAAGKIFRIGILMYGKPPTPRELLRWVHYR